MEALGERDDMTSVRVLHKSERLLSNMHCLGGQSLVLVYDTVSLTQRCGVRRGWSQITPRSLMWCECRAREEKWHYGLLPQ
jgi:hypothetical protein